MKKNIIQRLSPVESEPRFASARIEYLAGATFVWLMFIALGLNIWPGWARIGEWLR